MAFTKREYKSNETVITAQNLNEIQDEIIKQGQALDGKAPAGYGLGGMGKESTTFDAATASGFYSMSGASVTDIPETKTDFEYGNLLVINRYNTLIAQFLSYKGIHAVRHSTDGGETWNPVEYINPPMEPGVEYRTIDRHKGKAVYVKLVDLGTLPNATTTQITHSSTGANVISFEAFAVNASGYVFQFPFVGVNGAVQGRVHVTKYNVITTAIGNLSEYTGYAKVFYTKD